MVGERDLLARRVVDRGRQALGHPAPVDEHDRRTMRLRELGHPPGEPRPRGRRASLVGAPRRHHGGRLDAQVERLSRDGVDDRHRPRRAVLEAAEQPRHLAERPLRRAQPDALQRRRSPPAEGLEPLDRQRQVRSSLRRHERVDLVDDEHLDVLERGARRRREHEVERLGRRDEHVGGAPGHPRPLRRRRVPRADRDGDGPERRPLPGRLVGDPRQRDAQVLLDVDGAAPSAARRRPPASPPPLARSRTSRSMATRKRRQRLPRTGRREQQRRLPRAMGGHARAPARAGRLPQGRPEPRGDGGGGSRRGARRQERSPPGRLARGVPSLPGGLPDDGRLAASVPRAPRARARGLRVLGRAEGELPRALALDELHSACA